MTTPDEPLPYQFTNLAKDNAGVRAASSQNYGSPYREMTPKTNVTIANIQEIIRLQKFGPVRSAYAVQIDNTHPQSFTVQLLQNGRLVALDQCNQVPLGWLIRQFDFTSLHWDRENVELIATHASGARISLVRMLLMLAPIKPPDTDDPHWIHFKEQMKIMDWIPWYERDNNLQSQWFRGTPHRGGLQHRHCSHQVWCSTKSGTSILTAASTNLAPYNQAMLINLPEPIVSIQCMRMNSDRDTNLHAWSQTCNMRPDCPELDDDCWTLDWKGHGFRFLGIAHTSWSSQSSMPLGLFDCGNNDLQILPMQVNRRSHCRRGNTIPVPLCPEWKAQQLVSHEWDVNLELWNFETHNPKKDKSYGDADYCGHQPPYPQLLRPQPILWPPGPRSSAAAPQLLPYPQQLRLWSTHFPSHHPGHIHDNRDRYLHIADTWKGTSLKKHPQLLAVMQEILAHCPEYKNMLSSLRDRSELKPITTLHSLNK